MSAAQKPYQPHVPGGEWSNGSGDASDGYANLYAEDSRSDVDLEATRYLSAATHLSPEYANFVVRNVVAPSLRALAPAAGADVVVVARWALAALRMRFRRDLLLAALLLTALLVVFLTRIWLAIGVAGVLAISVCAYERWVRYHRIIASHMLKHRFDPAAAPTSPNPVVERRLHEAANQQAGNLVVFRGRSAFVGSGRRRVYRRMVIDLRIGSRKKNGKRNEPIPFTVPTLHSAMRDTLRRMGLPNLEVSERLYVKGDHIADDHDILPDPLRPPASSVDWLHLYEGAIHPTPDARTYVCAEMRGWKGQLVVTLFARALLTRESLYIEWSFHVLSPINRAFLAVDRYFEASRSRQVYDCVRKGLIDGIPALFLAPIHLVDILARRAQDSLADRRLKHAISKGYVFNYGSRPSIREVAQATSGHYFLEKDQQAYIILAEQSLLYCIGTFLADHKVDLELFSSQANTFFKIVNKTEAKINANNATFGSKSPIYDQSQQSSGGSGSRQGANDGQG
ncbi:MAG TPA: hypothetical protein VF493_16850 [Terriglobales bacterium]